MVKETTNAELVEIINKGFQGMEDRFQDIKEELATSNNRLEAIETRLDNFTYRFEHEELKKRLFGISRGTEFAVITVGWPISLPCRES